MGWLYKLLGRRGFEWANLIWLGYVLFSAGWVIWHVVGRADLYLVPESPTLLYIDFLQALAFLVAWSVFVITVTVRIVNKGRDLEMGFRESQFDNERVAWETNALLKEADRLSEKVKDHIKNHPVEDAQNRAMLKSAEEVMEGLAERVDRLGQVEEENERLRRRLHEAGLDV